MVRTENKMIVCGIEEPAGYNEYLDFNPRSEGVEELCLAAAAAPTMNRYGFVWFGDHAELPTFCFERRADTFYPPLVRWEV